jgi:hypothetical protein
MKRKNISITQFTPALGLIFGSASGCFLGLLTNNSPALTAAIGAGIGLVIGSAIYACLFQNK